MPFKIHRNHTTFGAYILAACSVLALQAGCTSLSEVREASGIALTGSDFVLVGDGTPGTVFRYRIRAEDRPSGIGPLLAVIEIDKGRKRALGGSLAIDLESVDVFGDGRVAVLSERLHALITRDGLAAVYPDLMAEFAGRGLEGLAIHTDGRMAALWEGGFLNPDKLPSSVSGVGSFSGGPFKPLICVHSLPATLGSEVCPDCQGVIVLKVPDAPVPTQAFRAPDLVWSEDGKSFIVLLSSSDAADDEFKFKWLQRFSDSGEPQGAPLNLCDRDYLPDKLRSGRGSNFEGLAWFERGKSLILINDHREPATAVVIAVDPWPSTDKTVTCDQALPTP